MAESRACEGRAAVLDRLHAVNDIHRVGISCHKFRAGLVQLHPVGSITGLGPLGSCAADKVYVNPATAIHGGG